MPDIADFVLRAEGVVAALYVVNPKLVERDDHSKTGVPYLFYLGEGHRNREVGSIPVLSRIRDVTPYAGTKEDLATIVTGRKVSNGTDLPSEVTVNGREIPACTLWHEEVPFSTRLTTARFKAYVAAYRADKDGTIRTDLDNLRRMLAEYDASNAPAPAAQPTPRKSRFGRLFGGRF